MSRHAAPQSFWESLQVSWRHLFTRGALGVVAVVGFVTVFALIDQRHVLAQPNETGRVIESVPLGHNISLGKTSCAAYRFRVRIDHPRPDLPEKEATFTACDTDYHFRDEVTIRRVPGHPDRTFPDPIGVLDLVIGIPLLGAAGAALLGVGWVGLEAVREVRQRRRQRGPGVRRPRS